MQILTHGLENAVYHNNTIYINGLELYGVVLVRVLCPQDLDFPFLMLRDEISGKVSLPVCKTCSSLETSRHCNHTERYAFHIFS